MVTKRVNIDADKIRKAYSRTYCNIQWLQRMQIKLSREVSMVTKGVNIDADKIRKAYSRTYCNIKRSFNGYKES